MWIYNQVTGEMSRGGAPFIGYSGIGEGKNNPAMQNVKNVGPLPCGFYTIEPPVDSPEHGPYALPLVPDPNNTMFGRDDFMIHGDSIEHPGSASEGCIILERYARQVIWTSNDKILQVIPAAAFVTDPDLEM
jgi:type VI secretion system (T6SS) effector TldE1-like protein